MNKLTYKISEKMKIPSIFIFLWDTKMKNMLIYINYSLQKYYKNINEVISILSQKNRYLAYQ